MAAKKTSKKEILENSIKLFKTKGYHNTSMADIASECDLIKGSLYHHFKSKDDIGLESLRYVKNYFNDKIFIIAYDDTYSGKEKMNLFIDEIDKYFLNSIGGCLLGNLALEVASYNVEFKDVIKEFFLLWENALVNILQEEYDDETSLSFAQECISLTQGSLMMMNLYNSKNNYLKIGRKLKNLY